MLTSDRYKGHEYRVRNDLENLLVVSKQDLAARFYDAENNLKKLKDSSKMIMDREGDTVTINHSFFNMIGSICDSLLKKYEEKQKELASNE